MEKLKATVKPWFAMSKPRFDITEIDVCVVCIHLLANGEYNDGTDAAEVCHAGQVRVWGDDLRHMVPSGDSEEDSGDRGFSWSSCDGCGDTDAGDRFAAAVLIPITD